MNNHFELRTNPSLLFKDAKSVISVALNYYPSKGQSDPAAPVLAKYAYGKDYHVVIRKKLKKLLHFIKDMAGSVNGRIFVDSGPVLEKAWAARSGIGWRGKNTTLISKQAGSFFFLGTLVVDLTLDYDQPIRDYCGTCQKCIDACPTGALIAPHVLDARRCISYYTVEKREESKNSQSIDLANRIFGCDICQDVCPWNSKALPHKIKEFDPPAGLLKMTGNDWHSMDEAAFNRLFKDSPVYRTEFSVIRRNLDLLKRAVAGSKRP